MSDKKKSSQVCVVGWFFLLIKFNIKQWLNGVEPLEMAQTLPETTGFLMSVQKKKEVGC